MKKREIAFLGHKVTNKGLEADPEKIEAIIMKAPKSVKETQRFIGMVNYLARFLPQLLKLMEPFRVLTMKNREFVWGTKQDAVFTMIKNKLTTTLVNIKSFNVQIASNLAS